MPGPLIGYGRQHIDESDIAAVTAALRGDLLTRGPSVDAFEADLRRITGAKHALSVSNGTAALRLLYQAVGIGPGKRVGVPALTFFATASQVLMLGAEVVLLDVDPETMLLTPETLRQCREHLDYLVPMHYAGRLCDMAGLAEVACARGITLVEDGAHAFGSTWTSDGGANAGHRCGDNAFSRGTILSFHPVKNITTGEGGAVLVNDDDLAKRIRTVRNLGFCYENFHGDLAERERGSPWYHEFHAPASNERMSDLHAALGVSQCRRLDQFKAERQRQVTRYQRELPAWTNITLPAPGQEPFWHMASVRVDWSATCFAGTPGNPRTAAMAAAKAQGIACMVHYMPLHHHPVLAKAARASDLAHADRLFPGLMSIPCYMGLSDDDQSRVIAWFRSIAR